MLKVSQMIGILLKVGIGLLKSNDIKKILMSKNRLNSGKTMLSSGLSLSNVYYVDNM